VYILEAKASTQNQNILWYLRTGVILTKDNLVTRIAKDALNVFSSVQRKPFNIFSLNAMWLGAFRILFTSPLVFNSHIP
jgi:hypothetical protein